MVDSPDAFLASNRELWDRWTEIHEHSEFYDLEGFRKRGVRLADHEIAEVGPVATGSPEASPTRCQGVRRVVVNPSRILMTLTGCAVLAGTSPDRQSPPGRPIDVASTHHTSR